MKQTLLFFAAARPVGKTPRLGQRGQLSEARSFHSFNANVALHITLPSLQLTYHLKLMVGRLFSFGEGLFSGAMFVLGRVHDMYILYMILYNVIADVMMSSGSLCWIMIISDMGVVHGLDESAPKIAKRDRCRGACTMHDALGWWRPFKPCRCCLTAALDVLFETLLLECCCIVVFGLPALLFPWQFQQRLFRQSTKARLAKVNGQTALFYAALQVRVKQIRDSQWLWWFAGMLLRGSCSPC